MNGRMSSINDPGEENFDGNVLRNEIHVFLPKPGWGIFNRNFGEISSGIDILSERFIRLPRWRAISRICYIFATFPFLA